MTETHRTACRVSIRGVTQGVGFRPFVYRVARQHGVAGWVINGEAGVEIHAEAPAESLEQFLDLLRFGPPSAATIAEFLVREAAAEGLAGFEIRDSQRNAAPTVRISPDLAVCEDCLRELADPHDRRHGYPYINCTHCGPRYSIVNSLPYDRANTTMQRWPLCDRCRGEYETPLDRRYHAQPTACAQCGPNYRLLEDGEPERFGDAAIAQAAALLRVGKIAAIKGIGGYHLACDAANAEPVGALRSRKYRKEKPFAVLVRDLDEARRFAFLNAEHERLLTSPARPIVLAPARTDWPLVAPDNSELGVMLPYAALHHLLFAHGAPTPLVLTSGNRSSEPIAYRDEDALARLTGIADAFLVGERPIARRVDDSVVAVRTGRPFMIRRSRGYAPGAVCRLPATEPILALGADLKNTIALVVDGQAFVSQHLGDLDDAETQIAQQETVRDLLSMYEVHPERLTVVHDLHPQYRSTRFAESIPAARRISVQHHHAHIASVLAEHELFDEPVLGVAFDGAGYGEDGTIWGGEFFVGSVKHGFKRVASVRPVLMPGGDAAARFPVQAAAAYLSELSDLPDMEQTPFCFPRRFSHARSLVARNVRCFASSSLGRLFDAAGALVGFTSEISYEGQAAIWLEHLAAACDRQAAYAFPGLDARPLLAAIINDRLAGRDCREIAAAFHAAIAAATVEQIVQLAGQYQLRYVACSGGVFQNELLWRLIVERFAEHPELRLITNSAVPVNDGGVALGQAAIASLRSSVAP
ncbi:MAG TPA: carbamoyltransferase HypF [Pirellulales bacterium]|nr:carbamoyltransferase HypF [Pirellulales bacterium]